MKWENICGHEIIKQKLQESIEKNRISHAQLFSGKNGWGTLELAITYASEILVSELGEGVRSKIEKLQHPDIHFTFPVSPTDKYKTPTSNNFLKEFREFYFQNPYGSLYEWQEFNEVEKKQSAINVNEATEIGKFISLNSYEGSYKFVIIWLPEMMKLWSSNKLLKALEEPPQKTVFLLITEREDLLLPTITSRCQIVKINRLSDEEVAEYLVKNKQLSQENAKKIALSANGDLHQALQNINLSREEFESYFIQWVRYAFMAKKNPAVLRNLVNWSSEISIWPREKQRQFLSYCSEIFRQALLNNYQASSLVFMKLSVDGFNWEKFSEYIHGANIEEILEEINKGSYHIERNANAKIVLLDLSILLTRHLHKKAV
ncbi:MAG: DNA polymerase III subunit delta' [Weeksellaceae bacterium]